MIAPELAEQFEGKALEREEAEALRRTTLTMCEDDEGTYHGRFRIPELHGQILDQDAPRAHLTRTRRRRQRTGIDPDLPTPVRHGIAFTQLIESRPVEALPKAGGCGATIVVTMTLEQLMADLDAAGVCTLDTGGHISAGEARRLACTAGIIPMVLGGKGQVLDVGRKRRRTPKRCAWRWACATAAAPPRTAKPHQACATPTTTSPGPKAAPPASRPAGCSVPTTTAGSTTRGSRPDDSPTGSSASAAESDPSTSAWGTFVDSG